VELVDCGAHGRAHRVDAAAAVRAGAGPEPKFRDVRPLRRLFLHAGCGHQLLRFIPRQQRSRDRRPLQNYIKLAQVVVFHRPPLQRAFRLHTLSEFVHWCFRLWWFGQRLQIEQSRQIIQDSALIAVPENSQNFQGVSVSEVEEFDHWVGGVSQFVQHESGRAAEHSGASGGVSPDGVSLNKPGCKQFAELVRQLVHVLAGLRLRLALPPIHRGLVVRDTNRDYSGLRRCVDHEHQRTVVQDICNHSGFVPVVVRGRHHHADPVGVSHRRYGRQRNQRQNWQNTHEVKTPRQKFGQFGHSHEEKWSNSTHWRLLSTQNSARQVLKGGIDWNLGIHGTTNWKFCRKTHNLYGRNLPKVVPKVLKWKWTNLGAKREVKIYLNQWRRKGCVCRRIHWKIRIKLGWHFQNSGFWWNLGVGGGIHFRGVQVVVHIEGDKRILVAADSRFLAGL